MKHRYIKILAVDAAELKGGWGEFDPNELTIKVSKKLGKINYGKTMLHEVMHVLVGRKKKQLKKQILNEEDICDTVEWMYSMIIDGSLAKLITKGRI